MPCGQHGLHVSGRFCIVAGSAMGGNQAAADHYQELLHTCLFDGLFCQGKLEDLKHRTGKPTLLQYVALTVMQSFSCRCWSRSKFDLHSTYNALQKQAAVISAVALMLHMLWYFWQSAPNFQCCKALYSAIICLSVLLCVWHFSMHFAISYTAVLRGLSAAA